MLRQMQRIALIIACVITLTALGCGGGPIEDLGQWIAATEKGDRAGFLNGLTKRSRAFVEGVWVSAPKSALSLPKAFPQAMTIISSKDNVSINGDRAIVLVSVGGHRKKLQLVKEDGRWRIDIFTLSGLQSLL